jgi:hypothetical protein
LFGLRMSLATSIRRGLALVGAACIAFGCVALANEPAAEAATRHARSRKAGPTFPMKADEYKALMEKRIDGVRAIIDKKLDRRGVSAERKKAIHKLFDDSSKDLRAEIARAAADGTVTQAEADKVKPLANGLRAKVRERMRAEKDPSAKEKLAKRDAEPKGVEKHRKSEKAEVEHGTKVDGPKVAKADGPKSGTTKATKGKDEAKKKGGGPNKHAKASSSKTASEKKKPREPAGGEADL